MEMQSAESELIERPKARWLAREKESGRIYDWATIGSGVMLVGTLALSYMDAQPRGGAGLDAVPAADRAAADRQPGPGNRADGAVVAEDAPRARRCAGRSEPASSTPAWSRFSR